MECVQWASKRWKELTGQTKLPTTQDTNMNAYDIWEHREKNSANPKVPSITVWHGTTYGHVGVVEAQKSSGNGGTLYFYSEHNGHVKDGYYGEWLSRAQMEKQFKNAGLTFRGYVYN